MKLPAPGGVHDEEEIAAIVEVLRTSNLEIGAAVQAMEAAVADDHGLNVVEDSCDVLDSWLGDERTGTRSDISVTSFARTHAITAGGNGGLVGSTTTTSTTGACRCAAGAGAASRTSSAAGRGQHERFGALADGTPYDLVFVFDTHRLQLRAVRDRAPPTAWCSSGSSTGSTASGGPTGSGSRTSSPATRTGLTAGRTTAGARTTWMRFCIADRRRRPVHPQRRCRSSSSSGASRPAWSGPATSCASPASPGSSTAPLMQACRHCDRVMDRALSLPIHHGLDADHMGFICEQLDELHAQLGAG